MTGHMQCRCGITYGPGADERRRHQMLYGHRPSPAAPVAPEHDLDAVIRERETAERAERRGR